MDSISKDKRPSQDAEALERDAVRLLAEQIEVRRGFVDGEFSIKIVHRKGELVEVHTDDHQKRTKRRQ